MVILANLCTVSYSGSLLYADAGTMQQQVKESGKITISGTVLDNYKMPVPGAVIFIKGTQVGVETDNDGKFTLDLAKAGTIEVVAMGYKTLTREVVKNETNVKLTLQVDNVLEEIVVTGIFKKSNHMNFF